MEVCKFREPNSHSNSRENTMKRKFTLIELLLVSACFRGNMTLQNDER